MGFENAGADSEKNIGNNGGNFNGNHNGNQNGNQNGNCNGNYINKTGKNNRGKFKQFINKNNLKKILLVCYAVYMVMLVGGLFYYNTTLKAVPRDVGSPLHGDQNFYDRAAVSLANDQGYTIDGKITSSYQIGYPLFLGFIYKLFGHSFKSVIIIQLFFLMTAYILYSVISLKLHKSWFFVPMLFFMFNYLILQYSYVLMTEILTLFFTILALYLLYKILEAPGYPLIAVLGVVYGLMTLLRPIYQLFPFFILPAALIFAFRKRFVFLKRFAVFFVAFVIMITPVMVRNYRTFGTFKLGTFGGFMFYQGTNPAFDGEFQGWESVVEDLGLEEFKHVAIGALPPEKIVEVDDLLFKKGFENVKKHPFKVMSIMFKNVSRQLFAFPMSGKNYSMQKMLLIVLNLGAVFLMVMGVIRLIRRRFEMDGVRLIFLIFCFGFVLYYLGISSLFAVHFRYGIYPVVIIYLLAPLVFWGRVKREIGR
jgi:hypothetical protein